MAINFPASPTTGQEYTYMGRVWVFDGALWRPKVAITSGTVPLSSLSAAGASNGQVIKLASGVWAPGTDNDSGGGGGGGIPEAPTDGRFFLRNNAGWADARGMPGKNLIFTSTRTATSPNYRGYTYFARLPGRALIEECLAFRFTMQLQAAGPFTIGTMKVLTTAVESLTVTSSIGVTIGASASPVITPPVANVYWDLQTDVILKSMNANNDYWLAIYFDSASANQMNLAQLDGGNYANYVLGNSILGNQTGVTTIPVTPSLKYGISSVTSA